MNRINRLKDNFQDVFHLIGSKKPANPRRILITGTPRSGTTWFGAMLNTESNLVFHEPFKNHNQLWNWDRDVKEGEDEAKFIDVFKKITTGKSWASYNLKKFENKNQYLLFGKLHEALINKSDYHVIVKDPTISYYLEYFSGLDFTDLVLIFRNPLSIVASLKRLNWDASQRLERMKEHPYLKEQMSPLIMEKLNDLHQMTFTQKLAFQTSIIHYMMYKFEDLYYSIKYEDFATDPIERFKELYIKLGLDYDENVEKHHRNLTTGKKENYYKHDVKRDSRSFLKSYEKILDAQEIDDTIKLYTMLNVNSKYFENH